MSRTYPDKLEIEPLTKPPNATVRVPGSKSITNRALVLAALLDDAEGCLIHGALQCEDTEVMVDSLGRLGFEVSAKWDEEVVDIYRREAGPNGYECPFAATEAELFVGNSGTSMRFLAALVSAGRGRFRLDGVSRMRERPIRDLIDSLRTLGVDARCEADNDCPPVLIRSSGLRGGHVTVRGDVSSQFLSALLMVAPQADADTAVSVVGDLVSEPYVAMTVEMMRQFYFRIERIDTATYLIPGRQRPSGMEPTDYRVEPDASAASYFFAAAAIGGGRVVVPDIGPGSLQGDVGFLNALEKMGCRIDSATERSIVYAATSLLGIDIDMNAISDTVMTLAAVACFADGPTTIRNVAHIRHKETDRIAAVATELRRLGAGVDEFPDGLRITPRPLHGAEVETYNDHRMAMSLALIGLRVPGVVIKNPGCVAKTYPGFWDDFAKLRET